MFLEDSPCCGVAHRGRSTRPAMASEGRDQAEAGPVGLAVAAGLEPVAAVQLPAAAASRTKKCCQQQQAASSTPATSSRQPAASSQQPAASGGVGGGRKSGIVADSRGPGGAGDSR